MASNAAFFALIATWVGRLIKTCSRSDKPDRDTPAQDDGFDVDGEGDGEGDGEDDDDFDFDFDKDDDVFDLFAGDFSTPSVMSAMTGSTLDDRFYARACVHSCARVYLRVRYVWGGTKVSRK